MTPWQVQTFKKYGYDGTALAVALTDHLGMPFPCPPPMVGQVWAEVSGDWDTAPINEDLLTSVYTERTPDGDVAYRMNGEVGRGVRRLWPPVGAILVAGPGAPWAPK